MEVCIFTTYNYQDGEPLIEAQAKQFVKAIEGMDIKFWSLRYNLPKRYMSLEQAIEHGVKHLSQEFDLIVFVPVQSVPISKEVLSSVIEKCKHGFTIVDDEAFVTLKDNYHKIKNNDVLNEVFTRKVDLEEKEIETSSFDPEIFNPFGCFLLKHKVPNIIFSTLEEKVNEVRQQLQNESFVNENNFKDYLAGKNSYQIKLQPTDDIVNYFLSLGYHYVKQTNTPFQNLKMGSAWINYAKNGDFNPIHTHDSLLSGTIYMYQGESIMQEMENGSISNRDTSAIPGMTHFVHDLNYHPFNKFSYSNKFVKGELIMFPSWLSHWVNPFKSNDERVTIAFNIIES